VKDGSSILSHIPVENAGMWGLSLINEYKVVKKQVQSLEKLLPDQYFVYHICPLTDFNGARFLYFANYQSIMDRAEWAMLGYKDMQFFSTQQRKIFYLGNANMHDDLRVYILNVRKEALSYDYDGLILRAIDEQPLAFMRIRKTVS
jgi:probable biosynthetic protein (TIGR04098 family)